MPEPPKKKLKKMKRPGGATESAAGEGSQTAPRTPEAAIPVVVEDEAGETPSGEDTPGEVEAPSAEQAAGGEAAGPSGADAPGPAGGGVDAAGPETARAGETPAPAEETAGEALEGRAGGTSPEPAGSQPEDIRAAPAGASPEAAERPDAPLAPRPEEPSPQGPHVEERWEAEPVEPSPPAGPAGAGPAPGEPHPRLAVKADDELLRLKAEISRKSLELESERSRLEELGEQLISRAEELEGRHQALDEREQALRTQDADLSKKSELVQASSEALGALSDEINARHKKVLSTESELRSLREEIDRTRADITAREERLSAEHAALVDDQKKAEKLLSDIHYRETSLVQGESDFGRKAEELGRARKEAEELDARLKAHEARIRRKEEEVRALEQHLQSIEEEIRLCPHCGSVEEFQQLARRAQELRARGEETEELNLEIKKARQALSEGFYDTAAEHARRAADLLVKKEHDSDRRDIVSKIMAAEGLAKMLREAHADVNSITAALSESWAAFKADDLRKAAESAEKARREAGVLEQERFQALDALVASNSQLATLKKSGVNVLPAEKKRDEAERAMASGDFRKARMLAAETVSMVSESAQSQEVSTAMSQIKLAEETIEELRSLGLDATEWERTVNRSREFLKKLDFKSAEETARWVRQKSKEAGRLYRQALLTIDHGNSLIATYRDMGLVVRKAEELQEEAKSKLREGDADFATNLAKKAERMVKEISERHKGAQAALRKASALIRTDRKAGKDITRSEKLYDLAQHQLELGEYANAMKLANKAVEALTATGPGALELCPTCGEAIPENAPECPGCAERNRRREQAGKPEPVPGSELAQKTKLGAKGGRKYACPYCGDLFEILVPRRPITITCPWCSYDVSVVE
jgi:HEPN domain-containing protein